MNIRPKKKVLDLFHSGFFWDTDLERISFIRDKYLIIERVLSRSSQLNKDIPKLESVYSKQLIIDVALNSREIFGNEQIEAIANYYNINPKHFKKYIHLKRYYVQ